VTSPAPPVTGGTSTTPGASAPGVPPAPDWGAFAGAPPPLEAPPGGSIATVPVAGGARVVVRRRDGSVLATARVDPSGDYTDARYFDRAGRIRVFVAALRAAPLAARAVAGSGALVRCGSSASADAGFRWARFPARWRFGTAAVPRGMRRAAALRAIRRARSTWNATRSHCRGIADRSAVRFAFAGSTPRRAGRDGVSVVEFGSVSALGGVCPGAIACTITFVAAGGAAESDTRVGRAIPGGVSAGRPGPRQADLTGIMVHESGHTLGFDHVAAKDVVMNPVIRRGSVSGRLLGRGDALASNRKY
jgi:hypothetical protein